MCVLRSETAICSDIGVIVNFAYLVRLSTKTPCMRSEDFLPVYRAAQNYINLPWQITSNVILQSFLNSITTAMNKLQFDLAFFRPSCRETGCKLVQRGGKGSRPAKNIIVSWLRLMSFDRRRVLNSECVGGYVTWNRKFAHNNFFQYYLLQIVSCPVRFVRNDLCFRNFRAVRIW